MVLVVLAAVVGSGGRGRGGEEAVRFVGVFALFGAPFFLGGEDAFLSVLLELSVSVVGHSAFSW